MKWVNEEDEKTASPDVHPLRCRWVWVAAIISTRRTSTQFQMLKPDLTSMWWHKKLKFNHINEAQIVTDRNKRISIIQSWNLRRPTIWKTDHPLNQDRQTCPHVNLSLAWWMYIFVSAIIVPLSSFLRSQHIFTRIRYWAVRTVTSPCSLIDSWSPFYFKACSHRQWQHVFA